MEPRRGRLGVRTLPCDCGEKRRTKVIVEKREESKISSTPTLRRCISQVVIQSIMAMVKKASPDNFTNYWVATFNALLVLTASTFCCLENVPYPAHLLKSPKDATAVIPRFYHYY